MARSTIKPADIEFTACSVEGVDVDVVARVKSAATAYGWALSGRQAGEVVTVDAEVYAPCSDTCAGPVPYLTDGGQWRQSAARADEDRPCCRITLPRTPAKSVQAVRIDGVTLAASGYHLMSNTLMRVGACWPCADACEPPRISIDYTSGNGWDALGLMALEALACEFLAAETGGNCRLSARATSITRQGVSIQLGDAAKLLSEGLTGIAVVDAWIRTVNPNRLQQPSRVTGIDTGRFV